MGIHRTVDTIHRQYFQNSSWTLNVEGTYNVVLPIMSNGASPTGTSRMNVKICFVGIPLVFKDFQMARNCV